MRISTLCALASAALLAATPAMADTTAKDLQVMGRAIAFMNGAPSGAVNVGIVYNASTEAAAHAIQALMGAGLAAGSLTLKPVLVKADDAAGANVDVFLVTDGMGGDGAKAGAAAKSKHKLCVTTDMAQAKSGACMMGVQSDPKVQIVVNKASAAGAGISFAAAFSMMITEI
jgi:hypothetical protein